MTSKQSRKNCHICAATGREHFRYMRNRYRFDVDLPRKLVSDGRETVEVDEGDVGFSVRTSRIYESHVPHVQTKYPGIIAHIYYREGTGPAAHGPLLIDGHHRAAKCLQTGRPFFAYLLTEQESEQVLVKYPPGAIGNARHAADGYRYHDHENRPRGRGPEDSQKVGYELLSAGREIPG